MSRLVTAYEVRHKKFNMTHFRGGYDPDEVDDFLQHVEDTLQWHETHNTVVKAVTPND